MTKDELLNYNGRLSELPDSVRKEAIDFYKSIIKCYDLEDQHNIFDSAKDGVDYDFEDFLLANLSRHVYNTKRKTYEGRVRELVLTKRQGN